LVLHCERMADSDSDVDFSDEELEDPGLEDQDVVTKYKEAAKIANSAVEAVIKACVADANVVALCKLGDDFITEAVAGIYRSKKEGKAMLKGVAFPTCVSVNHCVCSHSPPEGDSNTLKQGDVVKIDLGCHVDGYIGAVAGSWVVGASGDEPASGKAADVIAAAYSGAEAMLRLVKPGASNDDIPAVLEKIAATYGCSVVEGVLSHQMKRFMIDGEKCVLAKVDVENKVESYTFEENEVYHLDVAMSTGDGKTRELDEKQRSVFKRAVDESYSLKMKASRMLLSQIEEKHPSLPFTLRDFEDSRARLGMTELMKHEMVHPYPVLFEKEGELVAHVKYTVLLMPNGTVKTTGVGSPPLATDKVLEDEDIKALLATSIGKKKKKKKKKKNKEAPTDAE